MMKNIICASVSFAALALIFVIQSFLLITTSHLVYVYETVSACELYCALCILYFSLKSYEQKSGKTYRFLFAKVFSVMRWSDKDGISVECRNRPFPKADDAVCTEEAQTVRTGRKNWWKLSFRK